MAVTPPHRRTLSPRRPDTLPCLTEKHHDPDPAPVMCAGTPCATYRRTPTPPLKTGAGILDWLQLGCGATAPCPHHTHKPVSSAQTVNLPTTGAPATHRQKAGGTGRKPRTKKNNMTKPTKTQHPPRRTHLTPPSPAHPTPRASITQPPKTTLTAPLTPQQRTHKGNAHRTPQKNRHKPPAPVPFTRKPATNHPKPTL